MKRILPLLAVAAAVGLFRDQDVRAQVGSTPNLYVELEPLVVTAPRMKIPPTLLIDGRINQVLLNLLQNHANARPGPNALQSQSMQALNSLSSPAGYLLKMRYSELGFLLTEGLAGTSDLILRQQIIGVARTGTNPQIRAAAMMAVSYNHDPGDHGVFQDGYQDQDVTVRWGSVEALLNWGLPDAVNDIRTVALNDASGALRIYAAQALYNLGDAGGRDVLFRALDDTDWVVRAMAIHAMSRFGGASDYDKILFNMNSEQNNFVKSEMCGTLFKLTPVKKASMPQ